MLHWWYSSFHYVLRTHQIKMVNTISVYSKPTDLGMTLDNRILFTDKKEIIQHLIETTFHIGIYGYHNGF